MTYPHIDQDAWDSAFNPVEITYSNDIFGQIEFDIWYCALVKGVGKQVYDPQSHKPGQRRTAVTVNVNDIGGNNYKRDFIAEIRDDGWNSITLPSLKALGVSDYSKINGAYCHVEMVKFGTYTKSDGTEGVKTAPKVLTFYKTLEECAAAAQGGATQSDWLDNPPPAQPAASGNGANGHAPGNEAEKQVALAFLPAIVKTAVRGNGVDMAALEGALKANPILAKYFTLASPEVAQAMQAALADPAF